ncbi:hypothetical protein TNCV_3458751 [Trichonephila clavipes]|nr:hypothetical protein TNCV_3458751 [Trichonephila clavipes]
MLHFLLILHLCPACLSHVDASDYAIGGALRVTKLWTLELQPSAFSSRKLTSSEKPLQSAYDREPPLLSTLGYPTSFGICWKPEIWHSVY